MRAAVLRDGAIVVRDDAPDPVPAMGQVLVEVKACGICGSDLHFVDHGAEMLELGDQMHGMPDLGEMGPSKTDLGRDVYMGHEFSAEILEVGPDTDTLAPGTIVTSIPLLIGPTGFETIVYCNDIAAGYGERMLLSAPLLLEVPNGLDPLHAALTEPMAVGLHAVNRSGIAQGDGALVLGCGPVGLAVIASLAQRGISPIVASDFSPARRAIATAMGAHVVSDAAHESALRRLGTRGQGPAARRLRGDRRPRHPQPGDARRSPQCAGARGRGVHGPRRRRPVLRHQQGTRGAVRPRLRPDGVRRQPALHRRGRDRRHAR